MVGKIVFSLLLTILLGTSVEARTRKRSKDKKKANTVKVEEEKKEENTQNNEEKKAVVEKKSNASEETQKIIERNEKNQPQRFVRSDDPEEEGKSEEERNKEMLEIKKFEEERERRERRAGKLLSQGVSGDELVGEEFIKWSTAKAKTTSKEFKRMYLENIKMKRILQRIYAKQRGVPAPSTNQQPVTVEEKQEAQTRDEEIFYIYGNYEDEEGELAGDAYIKWSALKAKTSSKQFRSLVKRNDFLQGRVQKLMSENRRLTSEIAELQLRNKRLLRG